MRNSLLMSYNEVGERLGISAARVCQIEQRALAKLRKSFGRLGIVDFRGATCNKPSGSKISISVCPKSCLKNL